jgi:hypothetical protein
VRIGQPQFVCVPSVKFVAGWKKNAAVVAMEMEIVGLVFGTRRKILSAAAELRIAALHVNGL